MNQGPLEWYLDIPIVSRVYFTLCVTTTSLVALDIVSPFSLYYNFSLITEKYQFWRVFTTFLFFGNFSFDFMFHMYFSIRYCRLLEENSFSNRTIDFVILLLYGGISILLIAPFNFVHLTFLGQCLTFMLVYVWGRRNPSVRMSFIGVFTFTANYLPLFLMMFSLMLGNNILIDVIGVVIGHIYFFLDDIYPELARLRGWKQVHYLRAPEWVKDYFRSNRQANTINIDAEAEFEQMEHLLQAELNQEGPQDDREGVELLGFNLNLGGQPVQQGNTESEEQTETPTVQEESQVVENEISNVTHDLSTSVEESNDINLLVSQQESRNTENQHLTHDQRTDVQEANSNAIPGTNVTLRMLAQERLRRRRSRENADDT